MAKYTIWTLNAATQLIAGYENDIIEKYGPEKVTFGDRARFSVDLTNRPDIKVEPVFRGPIIREYWNLEPYHHQLMNETNSTGGNAGCDEYFVPIPLKCLGRLGTPEGLIEANIPIDQNSDKSKDIYNSIINCQDNVYFPQNPTYKTSDIRFENYWDSNNGYGPYHKIRMNSKKQMGFYEMLCNWRGEGSGASDFKNNQNYQCKNILIGYSQGGLVARYLAFLDEYVFGGLAGIAGVITIGSPNFGSPLANENNADPIIKNVWKMIVTLLGLNNQNFPIFHESILENITSKFTLKSIDAIDKDILNRFIPANISRKADPCDELITTAIKWLSGLNGEKFSAFRNLSAESQFFDGSVYKLLYTYPHIKAKTGAIANANPNLKELFNDFLPWWLDFFLNIKSKSQLFQTSLQDSFIKAGEVYRTGVIIETGNDAKKMRKIQDYTTGVTGFTASDAAPANASSFRLAPWAPQCNIPPFTHDFVIPSVSELLDDTVCRSFLGNVVNLGANHLSGNSRHYQAGKDNYQYIIKFLDEIIKSLEKEDSIN